jgi:leucyl aminopeptidase
VLVGAGASAELERAGLRAAAAAFTRVTSRFARIGLRVPAIGSADAASAAQAQPEGAILARYRYSELRQMPKDTPLECVELLLDGVDRSTASAAAGSTARAAAIARDLANTPGHLTATYMGDIAQVLGRRFGSTWRCSTGSGPSTSAAGACSA